LLPGLVCKIRDFGHLKVQIEIPYLSRRATTMNLTSTMLKVDLAVLSVILGLLILVLGKVKDIKSDAVESAKERTEIRKTLEFHDHRIGNVEGWISGNSGLRIK
jgi:hypothetical protein